MGLGRLKASHLIILIQIIVTCPSPADSNDISLNDDLLSEISRYCPRYTNCEDDVTNTSLVTTADSSPTCCLSCSCDPEYCHLAGNCCPNVIETSTEPTANVSQNNETRLEPTSLQCVHVFAPSGRVAASTNIYRMATGVYMVTECPDGSSSDRNSTDEKHCEEPDVDALDGSLPYTSLASGHTYRNVYCANCHRDSSTAVPWKMYIACTALSVWKADDYLFPNSAAKLFNHLKKFQNTNAYEIEFLPPDDVDVTSKMCTSDANMVKNCSAPGADDMIATACASLNMPYIHVFNGTDPESESKLYANVFCYLCSADGVSGPPACLADDKVSTGLHVVADVVGELNTQKLNATSIMPDWEQTDLTHPSLVPKGMTCNDSYVYDPYTKACRRWYCPGWRELDGTSCIPVFEHFHNMSFTVHIKIQPAKSSEEGFLQHNSSDIAAQALDGMYGTSDELQKEIIVLAIKKDNSFLYLFARLIVLGITDNTRRIFDESTYTSDVVIESNNGSFNVGVSFSRGVKLELNSFAMLDIIVLDLLEYNLLNVLYRRPVETIEDSFGLPNINKLTFCTQVLLNRKELRDYNDNLFVKVSDLRLIVGEFKRIPSNYNELRVCVSDYLRLAIEQLGPQPPVVISPQAILSVVCNMLSIVGLIGTILTYIIFDELRSIPGKNNLMLAVHLLIAQLLYQFGMDKTELPQACVVFGMLIHLFWLTAIFWMNACTLHMFRTFVTGKSYRSVKALDPQVCCYALYCYTVSVIMVSINVAVAVVKSDGKEIGYGGHICYITDPVMVGWVFALPVGVIIVLNMGFFLAVVYQISASTMRRRGKSTDRANTIIYMKLSSLTGATWIFGYLYLWTDFVPFEYIFIVLNAGQGVFIFISFICTQRTTKLYRAFFRKQFSRLSACSCLCFRKRRDSSDGHTVEPNTVKATLTAGSSTDSSYPQFSSKLSQRARGFAASLGLKMAKAKTENGSNSHSHSQSQSDIFQESACGAENVNGTQGGKKMEVSTVSASVNKDPVIDGVDGVYKPDKINEGIMSSTAVAAISVHDLNVQVNRDPM